MAKLVDMTGRRYGRLTVLERAGSYRPPDGFGTSATWWCKCDCGSIIEVNGRSLRQGFTQSCGCLRAERIREKWANKRIRESAPELRKT